MIKKFLRKYGAIGIPIGLLGFLFDSRWIAGPFFIAGTIISGLSWILQVEIEGERTIEKHKKNKKN